MTANLKMDTPRRTPASEMSPHLLLIVPRMPWFLEDLPILPWGVHCLADYLNAGGFHDIHIWDLNSDDVVLKFLADKSTVARRYRTLFGRRVWCGGSEWYQMTDEDIILSLALNGCALLRHAPFNKSGFSAIANQQSSWLDEMHQEFQSLLLSKATPTGKSDQHLLVGVSVYPHTLAQSLFLAHAFKRLIEHCSIILGGNCIKESNASEIVSKVNWVDGVVFGYGEEVISEVIHSLAQESKQCLSERSIPGFINKAFLRKHSPRPTLEFRIPEQYIEYVQMKKPVFVMQSNSNTIHILLRRGCGWGHCSFCAVHDRRHAIHFDMELTLSKLRGFVEQVGKPDQNTNRSTIHISLDSETNSPDEVIGVINTLLRFGRKDVQYSCFFWMRAQDVSLSFLSFLASLKKSNVSFHVEIGVESLSPTTLKRMKKGSHPLLILEKLKMLKDMGGNMGGRNMGGNYFMFFPTETPEDVSTEVYFLGNALHLLKNCIKFTNGYIASGLDDIANNQEAYGVKIEKSDDFSLQEFFGLKLPWNNLHDVKYSLVRPHSLKNWLVKLYYWYLCEIRAKPLVKYSMNNDVEFRVYKKLLNLFKNLAVRLIRTSVKYSAYFSFFLLQLAICNFAYLKRVMIALYIDRDRVSFKFKKSQKRGKHGDLMRMRPAFFLSGNVLIRNYPRLFGASWQMTLQKRELEVLRYLYSRKSYDDVRKTFGKTMPENELQSFVERHVSLGSIVRHNNYLLSIFNDPEYASKWLAESIDYHKT